VRFLSLLLFLIAHGHIVSHAEWYEGPSLLPWSTSHKFLGDPTLRTYDPNSYAQQAVTFLCLDFDGVSTRHNELPAASCPSGIRAQIVGVCTVVP